MYYIDIPCVCVTGEGQGVGVGIAMGSRDVTVTGVGQTLVEDMLATELGVGEGLHSSVGISGNDQTHNVTLDPVAMKTFHTIQHQYLITPSEIAAELPCGC